MRCEKADALLAKLLIFRRHAAEAAMGHRLEDMKLDLDLRAAERAMQAHGVGQEQIARPRLDEWSTALSVFARGNSFGCA